jgi:hypothetical protein
MKITCIDRTVREVFADGYYRVPRFQRAYSWEVENVEDFWNDTVLGGQDEYFIGSIVVFPVDAAAFGIVDGQQRLTTITMMLAALRNSLTRVGESGLANAVHRLIERPNMRDQLEYVIQTETSYPYFQDHIQHFGDASTRKQPGQEEKALQKAFDFITAKMDAEVDRIALATTVKSTRKKTHELEDLRDRLLRLKLIFVNVDNEDDAYIIFETLNSRGKDLTVADLVKNHLLRHLRSTNKNVDIQRDKWNAILESFGASQVDIRMERFILHDWLSKHEYVGEKLLFKQIKKYVTSGNAKQFLSDLSFDANIYRQLYEPSYRKWQFEEQGVKESLAALALFRVTQPLPLLISLLREYDQGRLKMKRLEEVLRAVESFHFLFTALAAKSSSGGISAMYALHARELQAANTPEDKVKGLQELRRKLRERRPTLEEVSAAVASLRYSTEFTQDKRVVRYLLEGIYRKQVPDAPIDFSRMTIEHLAPESTDGSWNCSDDLVASIGNLFLLPEDLNGQLANKSLAKKVSILTKQKGVWVDPEITQATVWDDEAIEARTRRLAELAFKSVWKI